MPERRKYDHIPKEIREYIDAAVDAGAEKTRNYIVAAADSGAQKALILLGHEIARTGIKKILFACGTAVVGLLSAVTTWIIMHGSPPK